MPTTRAASTPSRRAIRKEEIKSGIPVANHLQLRNWSLAVSHLSVKVFQYLTRPDDTITAHGADIFTASASDDNGDGIGLHDFAFAVAGPRSGVGFGGR